MRDTDLALTSADEAIGSLAGSSSPTLPERAFDLAMLAVLLPVLLVIGAVIALAIYLDSSGSVIFRVPRVGRDGQIFQMFKFRKMRRDCTGAPVTVANDERFTPIGRFLADSRFDELPQIWNVIRGEMRLVGPRPEVASFVAEFPAQYAEILTVAPGITGAAQLRFLDERFTYEREDPVAAYRARILPQKISIDLEYARNHSLAGDLRILAQTCALPVTRLIKRASSYGPIVRPWLPFGVVATLLVVLFIVSSGNVT